MILLLAAPAGAAARQPTGPPPGVFAVPHPTVPLHDVVKAVPGAASARIAATASAERYPIGNGSDATIAVNVTTACRTACDAADPQAIANFVGTLVHGGEVELLTVQLNTPGQIEFDCGYGAQACYYSGENKIVISGSDDPGPDGASREFILAHEYGHHVAQHRLAPAPFSPAVDWGTARWASYKNVCQGQRSRRFFPGNEGTHYYRDPGEAFAESFAFNRFPEAQQRWAWIHSLKPDPRAFAAIRRDVLDPWVGRRGFTDSGRLPTRGRHATAKAFRTPLDGRVSLWLRGPHPGRFELILRSRSGRKLRAAAGLGPGRPLEFTVCGQSRLRAVVERRGARGGRFTLAVQRP
jgi:hypothetical protein